MTGLIGLLVLVVVVGIVYYILALLLDRIPMDEGFKQIARVLLILVCILVVLQRALPLLGVDIGF